MFKVNDIVEYAGSVVNLTFKIIYVSDSSYTLVVLNSSTNTYKVNSTYVESHVYTNAYFKLVRKSRTNKPIWW